MLKDTKAYREIETKKTLIFGASTKPERMSYMCLIRLQSQGHEIVAIGGREAQVNGVTIQTGHPEIKDLDTITLYMGEQRQEPHIQYLLSLNPKRIIFNPGAENPKLYDLAKAQGIEVLNACSLVMLGAGQY